MDFYPHEKSIITQVVELFRFLTAQLLMEAVHFRMILTQAINDLIDKMIEERASEVHSTLLTMQDNLHLLLKTKRK